MVLTSIYKRKGRVGFTLEYQDPQSGGLRQKAFPTKADAIAYRDSVREAWIVQPDVHARADVPFEEYAYRWLRATKTAVRAGNCLRHTFATHQLKRGTPIQDVAWQLRHRDIRMTFSVYGSHLPAPDRASLDEHYDRLLGGQRMSEQPVSRGDERREKARSVHRGKA